MTDAHTMKRLLALYLDGLASDAQRSELAAWLREHADEAHPDWALIQTDTHLKMLLAAQAGADATVQSVLARLNAGEPERIESDGRNARPVKIRRHRTLAWGRRLALAAALVVAAGMFLFVSDRAQMPVATSGVKVSTVSGEATVQRGDQILTALAGMNLVAGDRIRTVAGAEATLDCPDTGKTIRLAGETSLAMNDPVARFHLTAGKIDVSAPFDPGRSRVFTTPDARAVVVGTRFELVAAPDLTRVTVMDGAVDFTDLARMASVRVEAGFGSVVSAWAEPAVFPMTASEGLLALYLFSEGSGTTVHDVSGVGEPMHLTIRNPENVEWLPGRLRVRGEANIVYRGPATKIVDAFIENEAIDVHADIEVEPIDRKKNHHFAYLYIGRGRGAKPMTFIWPVNSLAYYQPRPLDADDSERLTYVIRGMDDKVFLGRMDGEHRFVGSSREKRYFRGIGHSPLFDLRFAPSLDIKTPGTGTQPCEGDLITLAIYGHALPDLKVLHPQKIRSTP